MYQIRLLCLILAALTLTLPAFAQPDTSPINYCAATLSYALPDGWAAGDLLRNQYGVAVRLASSEAALGDSVPADGQAIVLVNVIARRAITEPLRLDFDTDVATLLETVSAQAPAPDFTAEALAPLTVQDQPAASVLVHAQSGDMIMYALDLDAATVGMVSISAAPGAIDGWRATAQAFLESLALDAPRFALTDGAPVLEQGFASDDCAVAFAYPTNWLLTVLSPSLDPGFQAELVNEAAPSADGSLTSGQAHVDLTVSLIDPSVGADPLAFYAAQISTLRGFEVTSQQSITLGSVPALVLDMHAPADAAVQNDVLGIVIAYPTGHIATLMLYAAPGERDQWRGTALAVAASLQVNLPPSE